MSVKVMCQSMSNARQINYNKENCFSLFHHVICVPIYEINRLNSTSNLSLLWFKALLCVCDVQKRQ